MKNAKSSKNGFGMAKKSTHSSYDDTMPDVDSYDGINDSRIHKMKSNNIKA